MKLKAVKPFSPDDYYDRIYDGLASLRGVTDFRVISGGRMEWSGAPAYLMTCTFKAKGALRRLHHLVRVKGGDILFIQAWYRADNGK